MDPLNRSVERSCWKLFVEKEMQIQVKVWFARVPTHSHVADGPSRLELAEMEERNVKRKVIHWRVFLSKCLEMDQKQKGF